LNDTEVLKVTYFLDDDSTGSVDDDMGVSLGVLVLTLLRVSAVVLLWDDCIEELRGV
jgi:hypothetical protein